MKTIRELASQIKKNAYCLGTRNKRDSMRGSKEINKTIRFALGISAHYAHVLKVPHVEILNGMEDNRTYWALNYYKEYKWPRINKVDEIFETKEDYFAKYLSHKYYCPACGGISDRSDECTALTPANTRSDICDWKAYGLFGCLGKGHMFIVKDLFIKNPHVYNRFRPIEYGNIVS